MEDFKVIDVSHDLNEKSVIEEEEMAGEYLFYLVCSVYFSSLFFITSRFRISVLKLI